MHGFLVGFANGKCTNKSRLYAYTLCPKNSTSHKIIVKLLQKHSSPAALTTASLQESHAVCRRCKKLPLPGRRCWKVRPHLQNVLVWLPMPQRIQFNVIAVTGPSYFKAFCVWATDRSGGTNSAHPSAATCSSDGHVLSTIVGIFI